MNKRLSILIGIAVAVVVILVVTNTPRDGKTTHIDDLTAEQPIYYTPSVEKLQQHQLAQGLYVAAGEFTIPHGDMIANNPDPGCQVDEETQLEKNLKGGLEALSKTEKQLAWLKEFSGIVSQSAARKLQPVIASTGGYISLQIVPSSERHARCGELTIFVPQGSEIKWIEPLAGESASDLKPCAEKNRFFCDIDFAKFTYKTEKNVVAGSFKNWSHNRERVARLQVYFQPSESWRKIHPLSSSSGPAI